MMRSPSAARGIPGVQPVLASPLEQLNDPKKRIGVTSAQLEKYDIIEDAIDYESVGEQLRSAPAGTKQFVWEKPNPKAKPVEGAYYERVTFETYFAAGGSGGLWYRDGPQFHGVQD